MLHLKGSELSDTHSYTASLRDPNDVYDLSANLRYSSWGESNYLHVAACSSRLDRIWHIHKSLDCIYLSIYIHIYTHMHTYVYIPTT